MAKTKTDINSWRALYAAADRVKELAPWEWLGECDVFGVQLPRTGKRFYVSMMGALGEHYAVSLYLGDRACEKFFELQELDGSPDMADFVFEIPQIMVSFEDRRLLNEKDLKIIKQLGLKYRGANNWPMFRSYRPGFFPWFLEQDEIEDLTLALEQAVIVAKRLKDNPEMLLPDDDVDFLVRVPREKDGQTVWEDTTYKLPLSEDEKLTFAVDCGQMDQLESLPKSIRSMEVDFFMLPGRIGEPGERPAMSYMLMVVESETAHILGVELLQASERAGEMWQEVPARLVQILNKAELRPKEVEVSSPRLHTYLEPFLEKINIPLSLYESLPHLEHAKAELLNNVF